MTLDFWISHSPQQKKKYLMDLVWKIPTESPLDENWPECSKRFKTTSDELKRLHHKWRVSVYLQYRKLARLIQMLYGEVGRTQTLASQVEGESVIIFPFCARFLCSSGLFATPEKKKNKTQILTLWVASNSITSVVSWSSDLRMYVYQSTRLLL